MGSAASKVSGKDSLYALLDVTTDADADQLKRAYRRKALELHPDRNFSNVEEATALFAKVQAAYDLLTHPQEREWYDKHRVNHRYDTYDGNITTAADVRRVTSEQLAKAPHIEYELISGYFEKLKHEEQEAAFSQGIEVPSVLLESPALGSRSEKWDTAKHFYDAWSSFSTVKDYSWEDMYPLHAAQDRKTRRKFEQENKKLRDAARKEFNSAVKQAVVLLRQNDIRRPVKSANEKKPKADAGVKDAKKQEVRRMRESFEEQDWQKPEDVQTVNADEEPLECVVCEIPFETEFDLQDHKRSAKHKKALAAMKQQMLEDDMAAMSMSEQRPAKPLGKAKTKAKKKKDAVHILTCGTCGLELPGAELIAHKKLTRHP